MEKKQFKLTLKQNGLHSLERGMETFIKYERTSDDKSDFLLKEAVMFINHGVELLMKQVLVDKVGEHMIYTDIDKAITKVIEAKAKDKTVFNLEDPVHTADYSKVLERGRGYLNSPLLFKKTVQEKNRPESPDGLYEYLCKLNKLRNQIEHYGIEKEEDSVKDLIKNLKDPLIDFFKNYYPNELRNVEKIWNDANTQINTDIVIQPILQQVGTNNSLLIICEGANDEAVLNILIEKIKQKYGIDRNIRVVAANGIPYYSKLVRNFIAHQGNNNLIVVTDADDIIEERTNKLTEIGIKPKNQIIIEPFLESWLVEESNLVKPISQIKEQIQRNGGYTKIAEEVNLDSLENRQNSFKKFVHSIIE